MKELTGFRRDDAETASSLTELLGARSQPELVDAIVQSLKASTAAGLGEQLSTA